MTPDELNHTIDFIIGSQARLAAAQEQDRRDRIKFEEWSKALTARLSALLEQQTELLVHQSQRMDHLHRLYEEWLRESARSQKQNEAFQEKSLKFQDASWELQKRALHLLNLILDRLPPARRPEEIS
jgi:hypothetical protein